MARLIQQLDRYRSPATWPDNLAPITLGDSVCFSQSAYLRIGNPALMVGQR